MQPSLSNHETNRLLKTLKDMVPADERPVPGTSYLAVDTADKISSEPILKIFKEAFADRAK